MVHHQNTNSGDEMSFYRMHTWFDEDPQPYVRHKLADMPGTIGWLKQRVMEMREIPGVPEPLGWIVHPTVFQEGEAQGWWTATRLATHTVTTNITNTQEVTLVNGDTLQVTYTVET
jgi:hypothetical protein